MALDANVLASFISPLRLWTIATGRENVINPSLARLNGAVLSADISAFTQLTERLAAEGPAGVERLTKILNDYLSRFIEIVHGEGGEVISFAGDGVLALWSGAEGDNALSECVHRAGQCALSAQAQLYGYQAQSVGQLTLRQGIGAGEIHAFTVGGLNGRWEMVLGGQPVMDAGMAEQLARPGAVLISQTGWEMVKDDFEANAADEGFIRLTRVTGTIRSEPRSSPALPPNVAEQLLPAVPVGVASRLAAHQQEWLAELRLITVLFARLGELSHGPAHSLERIQDAVGRAQSILQHYEGMLHKVWTDTSGLMLMGVFGVPPFFHEDDAARGVQAALELHRSLCEIGLGNAVAVGTGRAYCGVLGNARRREYTIVGDVVNVASRLMVAARDQVWCDEATFRRAQGRVLFERLSPVSVRGKIEPVAVYCAKRATHAALPHRPMVGRQPERAVLLEALRRLEQREDGVVVIEGEAGIGKSRLLAELLYGAENFARPHLTGVGDAVEKSTAYHAWRPVFSQIFDLNPDEDVETQRERVLKRLPQEAKVVKLAPLLNAVLPLDIPENELTKQLSGEVRSENTNTLLTHLIKQTVVAQGRPLLLILEDAHWLDSASWALARMVQMEIHPLLLVAATRPMEEPSTADFTHILNAPGTRRLRLEGLAEKETLAMICERLRVHSLPEEVASLIVQRAEGNPFFSEELAYALRESGVIWVDQGECRLTTTPEELKRLSFPDSVQGVVTSRIDRLPAPQQLTLKVASVIGRLFAFRILRDVHPIESDREPLPEYLRNLERLDFTRLESPEPDLAYLFKHVITQEVAYNLLLFAQRRQLHRAVGGWYERAFEDDLSPHYPILAHHWSKAEDTPKAIEYLERAGEQAFQRGAFQEAAHFFEQALKLDDGMLPRSDEFRRARWERHLAASYLATARYSEGREHALRALSLLGQPAPATKGKLALQLAGQLLLHLWSSVWRSRTTSVRKREFLLESMRAYEPLSEHHYYQNELAPAIYIVFRQLNLGRVAGPSPQLARAYGSMSLACAIVGLTALARIYGRRAVQTARETDDLWATRWVTMCLTTKDYGLGDWASGRRTSEEQLRTAEQLGDPRFLGMWYSTAAVAANYEGRWDEAILFGDRLQKIANRRSDPQQLAWYRSGIADVWLRRQRLGDVDAAIEELTATSIGELEAIDRSNALYMSGLLALARLRQGDEPSAEDWAATALRLIESAPPTFCFVLSGYVGCAEVYLDLWRNGHDGLAGQARRACAGLRRFALAFPIGRPRAWLARGELEWLRGCHRRALRAWRKSLAHATRLQMPFEQGLAHLALGRHLDSGTSQKQQHLTSAQEIFSKLGAEFHLAQTVSELEKDGLFTRRIRSDIPRRG